MSALRDKRRPLRAQAFTLAELLVVTGVIVVALGIVVPSLHGLFTQRSDAEAEAAFGGMITLARGVAIGRESYGLLHVQMGGDGRCWAAVFRYDFGTGRFVQAEGTRPHQFMEHMAFGEISDAPRSDAGGYYVKGSEYAGTVNTPAGWKGFTTFNVIFAPDGSVVTEVGGSAPVLDENQPVFKGTGKEKIWEYSSKAVNETGVWAVTVFDYSIANLQSNRSAYLDKVGRFVCINRYTGRLIRYE